MQILLSKSVNSAVAEVTEVVSDTQLRIKKEFGGDSGKGSARIREKTEEMKAQGIIGLDFKRLPFVNQQEMYRHVYQRLTEGSCIGIFPEGALNRACAPQAIHSYLKQPQVEATTAQTSFRLKLAYL